MPNNITAVLTSYNRPDNSLAQLKAIRAQVLPPDRCIVVQNQGEMPKAEFPHDCDILDLNFNSMFHGRFAAALLATTKYVAIFDDDVLPGPNYLTSCVEVSEMYNNSILVGSGVRLLGDGHHHQEKYGWNSNPTDYPVQVDFGGHSWFCETDTLKYLWYERPLLWNNGEDIAFSYLASKYGNVSTYALPHPPEDSSVWSNIEPTWGSDEYATYKKDRELHLRLRDDLCRHYISSGWDLARFKLN